MIMRTFRQVLLLVILSGFMAGAAWAADPASCNSGFTACQIRENVLLQLPGLAIAGDVVIQEPGSTNVSDVFRVFNNVVDTGGGTGLGNLVILYSGDDSQALPNPSTYSANAVIIKEAASGPTSYVGNGTTYNLDTGASSSHLAYTGDTTADYHDPAKFSALLTQAGGSVVPNATVTFTTGAQSCSATTNASGVASCSLVLNQPAGGYTVTASFGGIFGANAATSASSAFTITKEETTLSYTGDAVIANGGTAQLSGVLLEDNVTPIVGRTVTFTLGLQTCSGTTDVSGKAACTISPVAQPLGPGVASDAFAGDAFYRPSSASTKTVLFAFPTDGAFVLGDGSSQPGTYQVFWGAQWAADNILSGGSAPRSFKGFAESLSSGTPRCGVAWTSSPGNSSNPPSTVPAYMGVLVSPSVTQSGSTLSGSGIAIVVVKTDAGYDGDPGHTGAGTIVAPFCH
jgi:hypothetical protein